MNVILRGSISLVKKFSFSLIVYFPEKKKEDINWKICQRKIFVFVLATSFYRVK